MAAAFVKDVLPDLSDFPKVIFNNTTLRAAVVDHLKNAVGKTSLTRWFSHDCHASVCSGARSDDGNLQYPGCAQAARPDPLFTRASVQLERGGSCVGRSAREGGAA
eukprot:SAG11_NODE_7512_length_1136_cov_0.792671_1_plen_106_part_00